ncbi:MAG TPA: nitrilase-related carbon-nitrogen hydrolase, partial [Acidimicrobiales bacterium]|nr:nitrilase-related carbon-nitrogen hydrolase [Acidimicrobiales bacterium]
AERIAEPAGGPSTAFLVDQAAANRLWVCGSLPELAHGASRPSNCLVLAGPDGTILRYRKIHPFSFAGEHERYEAGDKHVTVMVEDVRLSLFVCYDLRFADEFWSLAGDTDCYVVVANWPATRREHWMTLLRARAIENQAYVVAVNRVGSGDGLDYSGDSAIIGPFGEEVVVGGSEEAVLLGDVEPAVVSDIRARFPFLVDRR